ncbi:hypothetical protein LCGC14_0756880 [marine sediment metagenome]|uniref:Uncharacterized protein n=1 Tax=marine sediment metagenome TaxID=412755 RepID=A0A0F9T9C3_9ZZZZ
MELSKNFFFFNSHDKKNKAENDNIMSVQVDFDPEIFSCPFLDQCKLPKHQFLCENSSYKTCSEYSSKLKKIKTRVLF